MTWNVTYEIVTPESAEHGEAEDRGFIAENVSLRDAIRCLFETRTSHNGGIWSVEPSDSRAQNARWVDVQNATEFLTGANEFRAIHIPEHITGSSRARLCRLLCT